VRVAFVTPRYGPQVIGGAEAGARDLAEHLARRDGFEVEVFSTCALDRITWDNVLSPGTSVSNDVTVHRFETVGGRSPAFNKLDEQLRLAPRHAARTDALRWVELSGPVSPGLVDAVADSGTDVAVFYPYLYHPIVAGIGRVEMPTVLHPAAHDEPALYLPLFSDVFGRADAFCYHSEAERRLVQRVHRIAERPQIVLGLGVGEPVDGGRAGREVLGIGDRPYVISVGWVAEHKGSAMLAAFFALYKQRNPGSLALALVGPVSMEITAHPDVVVTGVVDEATKWDLLRDATALVSPSALESFSLVVMEAWEQAVPVVVNALCEPTVDHCRRSGGGVWFESFLQFEAVLNRLLADSDLRQTLGRQGHDYVRRHFRWPVLIERYAGFLAEVAERGPARRRSGASAGRSPGAQPAPTA
jgi:glycosyltransferase involved in cell wall biosynthesis